MKYVKRYFLDLTTRVHIAFFFEAHPVIFIDTIVDNIIYSDFGEIYQFLHIISQYFRILVTHLLSSTQEYVQMTIKLFVICLRFQLQ